MLSSRRPTWDPATWIHWNRVERWLRGAGRGKGRRWSKGFSCKVSKFCLTYFTFGAHLRLPGPQGNSHMGNYPMLILPFGTAPCALWGRQPHSGSLFVQPWSTCCMSPGRAVVLAHYHPPGGQPKGEHESALKRHPRHRFTRLLGDGRRTQCSTSKKKGGISSIQITKMELGVI